jgi:hypothetical protein
MFSFLDQHLIGFNKLYHDSDDSYFGLRSGVKDHDGKCSISYKGKMKNPLMLGFDFNCSGSERTHMFEILAWMGKKIGCDPSTYYYDGETTKISPSIKERFDKQAKNLFEAKQQFEKRKTLDELKRMVAVWDLGAFIVNGTPEQEDAEIDKRINVIEDDIKRLDALWL